MAQQPSHGPMKAALACQDVDALRLHLRQLAEPSRCSSTDGDEEDPAVELLAKQANRIADSLLARGLPHLERAVAAEAAAAAEEESHSCWPTLSIDKFGLTMRAQPVMGHAVWPAAIALCSWLQLHGATLCSHASVLELGAGGGAPSLVAYGLGASLVVATDGDASILPLLRANFDENHCANAADASTAGPRPGGFKAELFDWRDTEAAAKLQSQQELDGFDLVLAADVLYAAGDIAPLMRAAALLLRHGAQSRLLVARSAWFEELQPTLVASAEGEGLSLVKQYHHDGSETVAQAGNGPRAGAPTDCKMPESAVVLEFARSPPTMGRRMSGDALSVS